MKLVKKTFYADRKKVRLERLERNLQKQVRDYEKILRDLHPIARRITHAILERAIDNRTWHVEFYVD